jgi:hypothetical protein
LAANAPHAGQKLRFLSNSVGHLQIIAKDRGITYIARPRHPTVLIEVGSSFEALSFLNCVTSSLRLRHEFDPGHDQSGRVFVPSRSAPPNAER